MQGKQVFRIILGILAIMALILITGNGAWAGDRFKTLHKFKRYPGGRGYYPYAGLIFDAAGNIYGTTAYGGARDHGTVFELMPKGDGSWTEHVLHSFKHNDGHNPFSSLIFNAAGNLYGTTGYGGAQNAGAVFELTPNGDGSWTENVIHEFRFDDDGGHNPFSSLILDAAGNLYGTTEGGGAFGAGTVFELTPNADGSWTESVLHSFNGSDGATPYAGLTFDAAGNLYGTAGDGGAYGHGAVFQLTPNGNGSWTESVLHSLNGSDGAWPRSGLILDEAGNLYGTTSSGGDNDWGTVFKLTPIGNGSWTESVLHSFNWSDGISPVSALAFDAAGNLYGTTDWGGAYDSYGTVFKLRPTRAGGWRYSVIRSFMGHPGARPDAGLVLDQAGNLYGTTAGSSGTAFGSVFEIIP